MTRNRQEVIEFAKQNGNQITKKQAVALLGKYYYSNADFHVGNSLSRLVNSGVLKRLKRGHFELSQSPISKPVKIDEKQLNIF